MVATAQGTPPATLTEGITLPAEIPLAARGSKHFNIPMGTIAFGPGGTLWSAVGEISRNQSPVFGSIGTTGSIQTYTVNGMNQWPDDMGSRCMQGGDGLAWCLAVPAGEFGSVIDRFSAKGFDSIVNLGNFVYVTSMALDERGRTWIATADSGPGFYVIGASAKPQKVASLSVQAGSLVEDPLKRGMWFSTSDRVGLVTWAGKIQLYRLPHVGTSNTVLEFFLGPDGNFWMPWPAEQWVLLKFDTNGHVVSETPIAHTKGAYAPNAGQFARDAHGNTFTVTSTGVARIARDGSITEYPTIGRQPAGIAYHAGKMYVTDSIVPSNGRGVGGLVVFDPTFW